MLLSDKQKIMLFSGLLSICSLHYSQRIILKCKFDNDVLPLTFHTKPLPLFFHHFLIKTKILNTVLEGPTGPGPTALRVPYSRAFPQFPECAMSAPTPGGDLTFLLCLYLANSLSLRFLFKYHPSGKLFLINSVHTILSSHSTTYLSFKIYTIV